MARPILIPRLATGVGLGVRAIAWHRGTSVDLGALLIYTFTFIAINPPSPRRWRMKEEVICPWTGSPMTVQIPPPTGFAYCQFHSSDEPPWILLDPPRLYAGPQTIHIVQCIDFTPWRHPNSGDAVARWVKGESTATVWGQDGQPHDLTVAERQYTPLGIQPARS